ncbi:helix-turn-helix domain-containing protein [Escherichia coli]|uniref:helix-turn-helix domain-containing protein n=1 Tax=Escherichia coli TaxID=562 RepID=UPI0038B349AA
MVQYYSLKEVFFDNSKKIAQVFTLHNNESSNSIHIEHVYVASFTLVCVRNGSVKIIEESGQITHCDAPGMIVLEKEQYINVFLREVDGHLRFEVLEIPSKLLMKVNEFLLSRPEVSSAQTETRHRVVYTRDFPIRREVFDLLKEAIEFDTTKPLVDNENTEINYDLIIHSLLLLLSFFIQMPVSLGMISRSLEISVKDMVYNILYKNPEKQWKLVDVSSEIFMSTSTLKRKLAAEGITFSELYITARMNLATKLLRTGKYNVSSVAEMCGYESVSYFISCFKKQFHITPLAFMNSINH